MFDLDGVLIESEQIWDTVREGLARERGGRWGPGAHRAMMGMSTPEWVAYMREELGVDMAPGDLAAEVSRRIADRLRHDPPVIPGAPEAVRALADRWPLGLASSSSRPVIEAALTATGLAGVFRATVSSEEVARGKPAPDVFLRAAELLGVPPARAVAVEDSTAGIRAAHAAGMAVVAIPNRAYPPDAGVLALAAEVLDGIGELTPAVVGRAGAAAAE